MAYFVRDQMENLIPDHPPEGFDLLADAMLFARSFKGKTKVRREDV